MANFSAPPSPPPSGGRLAGVRAFLGRHPALCLLVLSPGIPEYLSGSSPLSALVANPLVFFLQLAANLGLYGPGVLLVREAVVRYRKGWPSLLAFGCAYAILEEGVALSTFFNPNAGPVGMLGYYGHFLGVSWVWVLGLLMVHTVYSISLPILLLSLALPQTNGRPLLTPREIGIAIGVLALDVAVLSGVVVLLEGFWLGLPLLGGSFASIAALVYLGFRLSPSGSARPEPFPRRPARYFFLLGLLLFPGTLLEESLLAAGKAPAVVTFLALGLFYAVWGIAVLPRIGRGRNQRQLLGLAAGLLAPLMLFGLLAQLALPVVLLADALTVGFLVWLRGRHPEVPLAPSVPDHVLQPGV